MSSVIFVAEDDVNINEVVCEYLKESGFEPLPFFDGKKALENIGEGRIDLFILDIMLPNVTGITLLEAVRKSQINKDKPVIMLTALGDEYTQLLSFESLADDYITKPFSPKILMKRVEALLRRSGKTSETISAGDIVIDVESYEAYENDEKIQLTLREFELLKALICNKKKVLTRQQLLDYVWGYDYFGDERIVDVHIKNLRKKLNGNIISTVKGVGYRLVPEGEENA